MASSDLPDGIDLDVPPGGTSCADCDSETPPGWWVHLRRCAACGHIGCCDTSPGQHATAHAEAIGHPIIQTFEPDEDWFYDYETGQAFDGPDLAPPASRPDTQGSPAPADRVPRDWMQRVHR